VTAGAAAAHRPGRHREHEAQEGVTGEDEPHLFKGVTVSRWKLSTVTVWRLSVWERQAVRPCYLVTFYKRIIPAHGRRERTVTTNLALGPLRIGGLSAARKVIVAVADAG
jgi:hypothetical protein